LEEGPHFIVGREVWRGFAEEFQRWIAAGPGVAGVVDGEEHDLGAFSLGA